MEMYFGEHITIDGYGGSEELLNSRDEVLRCLSDLPAELGMKKLAEPEIYFAKGGNPKDPGGWTGVVVIEESHISIHTFPKRGFVSADVYTCKNGMNQGFVVDFFKNRFKLKEIDTNFIKRGLRYPEKNIY